MLRRRLRCGGRWKGSLLEKGRPAARRTGRGGADTPELQVMRIALSTGGGDAPGLNAVIRAVVLSAHSRGWQAYGIQRGYEGLLSFNGVARLGPDSVRGITHLGGPILGTTNRGNPFRYVVRASEGKEYEVGRSDDLVAAFHASGFDALVSIGGDGSLQISHQLWCKGLPLVFAPKTTGNDGRGPQRPSRS